MNKTIAYCTAVYQRLEDLEKTFPHNLEILRERNNVSYNVVAFDEETLSWLNNFSDPVLNIYDGRYYFPGFWHFSICKNFFQDKLTADYYSNLDADNFIFPAEVSKTFDIINKENYCFLHHVSQYGIGDCGRITVPTRFYDYYGYPEYISSSNFDDLGFLLTLIYNHPEIPLYGRINFVENFCKKFIKGNYIFKKHALSSVVSPLNKGPKNLVNNKTNMNLVFAYLSRYRGYLEKALKFADYKQLNNELFQDKTDLSDEFTLYGLIRNDRHLVEERLEHYRNLGIKRFVFIKDPNDPSDLEISNDKDVIILKPKFGFFALWSALWLNSAIHLLQKNNSKIAIADMDEFVEKFPKKIKNEYFVSQDKVVLLRWNSNVVVNCGNHNLKKEGGLSKNPKQLKVKEKEGDCDNEKFKIREFFNRQRVFQ